MPVVSVTSPSLTVVVLRVLSNEPTVASIARVPVATVTALSVTVTSPALERNVASPPVTLSASALAVSTMSPVFETTVSDALSTSIVLSALTVIVPSLSSSKPPSATVGLLSASVLLLSIKVVPLTSKLRLPFVTDTSLLFTIIRLEPTIALKLPFIKVIELVFKLRSEISVIRSTSPVSTVKEPLLSTIRLPALNTIPTSLLKPAFTFISSEALMLVAPPITTGPFETTVSTAVTSKFFEIVTPASNVSSFAAAMLRSPFVVRSDTTMVVVKGSLPITLRSINSSSGTPNRSVPSVFISRLPFTSIISVAPAKGSTMVIGSAIGATCTL